jgi:hypothetical protein
MDPMPGTDTAALGAGRHVLGDLEGSVDFPNALVIDAENGQILGLDAVYIRSVRDGEGATLQVIVTSSVELGKRVTRARIFSLTNISVSVGITPELGGARVASQLGHGGATGGELEEFASLRRIVQVSVHPPLLEGVLLEGSLGPVVVGEVFSAYVISPH